MAQAVTELVIDPTQAEQGAASFSDAMAKAGQAANDNLKSIADSTAAVSKQISGLGSATQAATDASGSSWGSFATKVALGAAAAALGIGALYTAFKILYEIAVLVPNTIAEAWDLGNAKLAEYVALSQAASASGVSTDFFQRMSKAATDAKLPVDDLTAAFKKLTDATADTLGGSAGQQRLNQLTTDQTNPLNADGSLKPQTGNFQGNTGLAQLADANTTEEKFRAIASLIDQAMSAGQRLAALDVAKTFLGDAVAGNLARDSDYLNKMIASADAIKSSDLIPQDQVDNAVALQNRLDAAEQILSQRWHPIQDLLTQGGIAMKEVWVTIVENIASAFDWVSKLVAKLGEVPSWFQQQLNNGATAFMNATTTPESRKASEASLGISSDPQDMAMLTATNALRSGLGNPANVAAAAAQSNTIQNAVIKDTSVVPKAPAKEEADDSVDRAINTLEKHTQAQLADAQAVGLGDAALAGFKADAAETAAVMANGGKETDAQVDKFDDLKDAAIAAAGALAQAKVASNIEFNTKTAFLSASDVQIATQLKGIYGNDVPAALNSTYASAIRVNDAFKQVSSAIETNLTTGLTDIAMGTVSVGQGFTNMGLAVVKAIEQMIIKLTVVQPLMQAMQASLGGSGILSFLGIGGSSASLAGSVSSGTGLGAGTGGLAFPMFAGGTDSAPGGWSVVGEQGPELVRLPLGSQVLPNGQMPANSNGGSPQNVITYAPNIDARGADAQAVARLTQAISDDRKNFTKNVVATMSKYSSNNPGAR